MPRRHALLALSVAFVWGVNFVVIDVGLDSFPPLLFAAIRFALIAVPAVFFIPKPDLPWTRIAAVGLTLSAGHFGFLFVAMDVGLPAGLASLVLQLQAAFTFLLAVGVLGERPSASQFAGVACSLLGIGVIALGRAEGVPLVSLGLCIAAAASWGTGNVLTRSANTTQPFALLVWSSLVAPVALFALSAVFEGPSEWRTTELDTSGLLALAYIVGMSTFYGFGIWTWLLSKHPAAQVAPFTLFVPVVGIAAAWIALAEEPNAAELVGAGVVLFGLALTTGVLRVRLLTRGEHRHVLVDPPGTGLGPAGGHEGVQDGVPVAGVEGGERVG